MPLRRYVSYLRGFDWVMFGAAFLLICFGLSALYSIGMSADHPDFLNFKKQLAFAAIAVTLFFLVSIIDYRIFYDLLPWLFGLATLLLVGVIFFGRTIGGHTGWFSLLGFSFQPVELAKLVLILLLARFVAVRGHEIQRLRNYLLTASFVGFFFLLVMMQPDLGSGMILFFIWFFLVILGGVNKKHLLVSALLCIVAAVFAWFFLFHPYQRDRILTFFNPQADPYGRGYHVRQATIAVGAGGLFGRGLGFGSQSQLKFIPASQTDFIFAVIAEELGFLGIALILFFWGVIFYRLVRAAQNMNDPFSTFFILGISILLFSHLLINAGMNMGIVPVTGISLPLMSYGGSFLVTCMIGLGIVESMIIRNRGTNA